MFKKFSKNFHKNFKKCSKSFQKVFKKISKHSQKISQMFSEKRWFGPNCNVIQLKKTHEGSVTFPITIIPVDDELPRVVVNKTSTYVTLNPDGSRTAKLSNKHLRSTDRDSYNPELVYQITTPPKNGQMLKLDSQSSK